jgi:molybdopterin synthase catalytic subunit/molybdopterin converting factor small subunit
VKIQVRLFAALREQAGASQIELELPDGAHVSDVWPALALGGAEPSSLAYALNRAYADREDALSEGDEVALIPPVSGGEDRVEHPIAELTVDPIDLGRLIARVADPGAGAIATFLGTVRNVARGREVLWLDYEAFGEMAVLELERVARTVTEQHGCIRTAIAHRTGRLEVGEASVAVAVSAAHRGAALTACQQAIDTLKQTVPIWKKERYADGEEWVSQGS